MKYYPITMEQNQQLPTPFPNVEEPPAEPLGNSSEEPGGVSEDVRNEEVESSERLSQLPKLKQPTDEHNITVREAAKLLEAQGHPITERTIINWCYPTKTGPEKLDCAWDSAKLKYFITQESLEKVMADMPNANPSEPLQTLEKDVESPSEITLEYPNQKRASSEDIQKGSEPQVNFSEEDNEAELRRLRRESLEQTNTIIGKDKVIDTLQSGLDKTVGSFTKALKELSIEQGRLLAENEQLHNLLGDGVPVRKPDMRESASASVENNDSDEDEEQPDE